ncbi:deoxyribose-phosphate aldolase [Pseudoalteromonas xiamenensis]
MALNTLSDHDAALIALRCMDLTSLNENDTNDQISQLCAQTNQKAGHVAAVCVYPQFVQLAKQTLDNKVLVATVTNFPHGNPDVDSAVRETADAVKAGADEVDVVFPYRALLNGDEQIGFELVSACKQACGEHALLKVIIESGELQTPEAIQKASEISIRAGADFIKTSTGKVSINATLDAAEIMLKAIHVSGKPVGFKAAGGVRTVAEARKYIELALHIMGADWVSPATFRFGASGLLHDVLQVLGAAQQSATTQAGY